MQLLLPAFNHVFWRAFNAGRRGGRTRGELPPYLPARTN
jgi:hypothetical protein